MVVIEIKTEREFVKEHLDPHGVYRHKLTPEQRREVKATITGVDGAYTSWSYLTASDRAIRLAGAKIRELRELWGAQLPVDAPSFADVRRDYATATGVFVASPTSENFVALVKAALPLLEEKK